jgi:hypothetical protein
MKTQITNAEFDAKLEEILSGMTGAQLLSIPGIYEIVSEEYNNEILEAWENERTERLAKKIRAYHDKHVFGGRYIKQFSLS